jgi:hypothetical protein
MAVSDANQFLIDFIDSEISIGQGIRTRASSSQGALREFLRKENSRDPSFPVLLQTQDRDFLGGSFARHTKIWPLDDIDIFFPLDGFDLVYFRNQERTSTTLVSDGKISKNPLLGSRWMTGSYISSSKLQQGFSDVLKRGYPTTEIEAADEAISIQTTIGASENNEGLNFDAVPCVLVKPNDGSTVFYLIPDGNGGWTQTNPRIDERLGADLQSYHNEAYRPAVKILKYWAKNKMQDKFGSYYTELACSLEFLKLMNGKRRCISIGAGLSIAFAALRDAVQKGQQISFTPGAPPVKLKGLIGPSDFEKLSSAASQASSAWSNEAAGLHSKAVSIWTSILE